MATGSHPSYPEMILRAIEALNKEKGSNKSSISKYIESTYSGLPDGHKVLLNLHLQKMKENGELLFWGNNYIKCHLNAPPRRGRGRPTKSKNPQSLGTDLAPMKLRGRDRPPKSKDPQLLGTVLAPLKLSGRDNPPKSKDPQPLCTILEPMKLRGNTRPPKSKDPQPLGTVLAPLKLRGHGRPPKSKDPKPLGTVLPPMKLRDRDRPPKSKDPQSLGIVLAPLKLSGRGHPPKDPYAPPRLFEVKISSGSGRPRGRPRKIVQPTGESNGAPTVATTGGRRPRGRPPKKKAPLT